MDKLSFSTIGVNIHDNGKPDEIATPIHICNDMTELFPSESFTDTSKIWADIYCKTGNTLKALKQHGVSKENIVAICPTLQSQMLTCRQLYGKLLPEVKIDKQNKYPDVTGVFNITRRGQVYYISNWKEIVTGKVSNTNALTIISKIILNEMRSEMSLEFTSENGFKFNNIIMNPPYNNDMYLDFVTLAHKLATDNVVAITPAKWQAKGGAKNEQFRKDIVPYMKEIVYYPDCLDIFPIQESSGICYYIVSSERHNTCKVTNISAMKPIINSTENRSLVNEESLWNCGQSVVNKIKSSNDYKPYILREIANDKKYIVNLNKQLTKATGTSGCWDWDNSCIKQSWIGKGGVLFTETGTVILPTPKLITEAKDNSSGTSVNIFNSDSMDEVNSFISWLNTKFIRFLILINIGSLTMMNERGWRFVPAPKAFDHIFTDQELYKEYDLTDEEINIIESVIKARK